MIERPNNYFESGTVSGGTWSADAHHLMRRLWTDHVVWTRLVIVSALAGLPDLQVALARLMQNQADIGALFATRFGPAAGAAVTKLLTEHIRLAVELVTAAKAGDAAKVASTRKAWQQNAADIAAALAQLDPSYAGMGPMLADHLALTEREAVDRIQGNWKDDRDTFDEVLTQALMMADALAPER